MGYWEGRLGVVDLETTDVDVDMARITYACVAILESDGDVVARWDWTAEPAEDGRPAPEVVGELAQSLRNLFALGIPVAVYNAPYDLTVLDRECRRLRIAPIEDPHPIVDPLVIDRAVDPDRGAKRTLAETARHYDVELGAPEDAAIAAGRIAQAIAARAGSTLEGSSDDLQARQADWYVEQAAEFQEHMRSVRGDENYVANAEWPLKRAEDPNIFEDTQPIPAPPLRPSATVPMFDFTESIPLALEAAEAWARDAGGYVPVAEPAPEAAPRSEPVVIEARAAAPRRVHIAAAIVTDAAGRTLLVRKHGSDVFIQPGGKIERGESAIAALIRELREEVGLEVDTAETEFLGSFEAAAAHEQGATVRAEVFAFATTAEAVAGGEIAEVLWVEALDNEDIEFAPLTRDILLPIWAERRNATS
jgi:DNA polymerase-3 subunit epsilon